MSLGTRGAQTLPRVHGPLGGPVWRSHAPPWWACLKQLMRLPTEMPTSIATRAACYRIEKRGNPENGWEGCWEECCENSGCWRESWQGCCSSFLSKETPLAAPSPALPPAPRIFAALFPAPSPAIFWIAPFLYSVAGRPGRNAGWHLFLVGPCALLTGRFL